MADEHSTQVTARKIYAREVKGIVLTITPREDSEDEIAIDFLMNGCGPQEVVEMLDLARQGLVDNARDIRKLA